jgi:hypothetical protein
MANVTWGQSPYLLNIPTVSNVTTSATGSGSITALQTQVNSILSMIDTTNKKIKTNSIANFSTTPIQVVNPINFAAGSTSSSSAISSITGNYIIQSGNLYISSMGVAVTCSTSSVFCDGYVYSLGNVCPSDPILKKDVVPYSSFGLPNPVRFTWKNSGKEDIGFLANDVASYVPEAVLLHPNGTQGVDYAKLVVLAIAEIQQLKLKVESLEKELARK